MRVTTYKGCTITETPVKTFDTHGRTFPLYRITGRYEKAEGLRPFIRSIASAKEWIKNSDLPSEVA